MRGLKIVLVMAVLLTVAALPAGARETKPVTMGLQDVISTVEQSYRQLTDVAADFFQRSTLAENRRELRGAGEMFLRPPDEQGLVMFRFDYFRPTRQEIICNGKTMWMYLPESRKVIVSDVGSVFSDPFGFDRRHPERERAVNFLQGLGSISRDFFITFSPEVRDVEGNFVLELEPRTATAFIRKLFIAVRRDSVLNFAQNRSTFFATANRRELLFPILSTTMVDHQGNTTTMEFSNVRPDARLPSSLFEFTIPAGVEVVKPPTAGTW